MKVNISFLILLTAVSFSVCAQSSSNNPSTAVEKLIEAILNNDTKLLDEYALPEFIGWYKEDGREMRSDLRELGKIIDTREEIDGDAGIVYVEFRNGDDRFEVEKVNGKWKAMWR
jgi:hypothetical protein